MIEPGRLALDPHNRRVTIVEVTPTHVVVKLAGPYGATYQLPASALRPIELNP